MKSRIRKLAAAVIIVLITVIGIALVYYKTMSVYGISEAMELLKQAKTLHIKGWDFETYHPDDFDTIVSAKLPWENWYDFENERYRHDSIYFDWEGKLDRRSTICDGEYEMSEHPYHLDTGERGKSIRFEEANKHVLELNWLQGYGRVANEEGAHKIGEEEIDGTQFNVWKLEITKGFLEDKDFEGFRTHIWISRTMGQIGRIKEWRRNNDGPWVQIREYTLEQNIVLSPDLFVTEPPEGYRLENTKKKAIPYTHPDTTSSGIGSAKRIRNVESVAGPDLKTGLSLSGKALPDSNGIDIDFTAGEMRSKSLLFCFFDIKQRPSRHMVRELDKRAEYFKEKGVEVVCIQVSKVERGKLDEWVKENKIPFAVGMIEGDEEKVRFEWRSKSLPWLILTDRKHIVREEGFAISELIEKLKQMDGE